MNVEMKLDKWTDPFRGCSSNRRRFMWAKILWSFTLKMEYIKILPLSSHFQVKNYKPSNTTIVYLLSFTKRLDWRLLRIVFNVIWTNLRNTWINTYIRFYNACYLLSLFANIFRLLLCWIIFGNFISKIYIYLYNISNIISILLMKFLCRR